jgi:ubiquinone/menaquinone biosynthesis C-methylase UbiE
LRVPSQFQFAAGAGLFGGLVGLGLLFGAPAVPALIGVVLVVVGVVSAAFELAINTITSSRRRERARRQILEAVTWRGDELVLDVGCGNGFVITELAKRLTDGRAIGIDLWKTEAGQQTPDVAKRNAQLEGVADRVEIRNADARSMPFDDGTFDVIVSSLMLHHAGGDADRQRVLGEMVRVLRPGGTILLYDVSPLITAATRRLTASGLTEVIRSGRIMSLVAARRSALWSAA